MFSIDSDSLPPALFSGFRNFRWSTSSILGIFCSCSRSIIVSSPIFSPILTRKLLTSKPSLALSFSSPFRFFSPTAPHLRVLPRASRRRPFNRSPLLPSTLSTSKPRSRLLSPPPTHLLPSHLSSVNKESLREYNPDSSFRNDED